MAKKEGVSGWHSMRKDELIRAIVRVSKKKEAKRATNGTAGTSKNGVAKSTNGSLKNKSTASSAKSNGITKQTSKRISSARETKTPTDPKVIKKIREAAHHRESLKDLARSSSLNGNGQVTERKDRIVLLVRDPFWLQAYWELKRSTIDRIRVAMSENWHGAQPTLRLSEIESINTTSTSESVVRDIEIHGGVSNWYIDVVDPPKCYRVSIGYKAANGKFYPLARSNKVTTPRPGNSDTVDENWTDIAADCEKVYALSGGYNEESNDNDLKDVFEDHLQRPIGTPAINRYGIGADYKFRQGRRFDFEVDAEMVIYGATEPNSFVTLAGEPVKLRNDGTFTVRLSMPDKRQVLPVVARSADGVEERTTVLAVERNTKVMEPMFKDHEE